jgi:four helix bundle protein
MRHDDPNGSVSILPVPSSASSASSSSASSSSSSASSSSSSSSASSSSSSASSSSSSSSGSSKLPFQKLDCYHVALALASLTERAGISDRELRDQATRAAKSAFLNLSEGLPSDLPAVRRRYFRQSDGSVHEVAAAVDLAAVLGAMDGDTAAELQQLALRLRQMLRGLLRATARGR